MKKPSTFIVSTLIKGWHKMRFIVSLFFACMLLISCANEVVTEDDNVNADIGSYEMDKEEIVTQEKVEEEQKSLEKMKAKVLRDNDGVKKIKYTVNQKFIDSLNEIAPIYDVAEHSKMSVSYYIAAADSLNGHPFFINNAGQVPGSIKEILSTRLMEGTDLVFMIDKTGSMDDDIEAVKKSLDMVFNYLEKFSNLKVAMVAYGDKNYHLNFWYDRMDLTANFEALRDFMKSYNTIGNADVPESVNDAIVRTVEEMNWTPGNRRVIITLGDAPSQVPPLSNYTLSQVTKICREKNVSINLYPIVVASSTWKFIDNVSSTKFADVYPNPVNEVLNVRVPASDKYAYQLYDQQGRKVAENSLLGKNTEITTSRIPSGTYLLHISNAEMSEFQSSMLVVQH